MCYKYFLNKTFIYIFYFQIKKKYIPFVRLLSLSKMKQFSDIYKHRICCCQWRFVVQSIVNTDNHLCRYLLCRYFTVVLHIWCIYSQIQINNQKTVLRQKVTVLCGEQEGGEENPSEMYDRKHTLSSHTTLPSTLEGNTRITVGKMYILIWVLFLLGRRDVWCFTHKPEMFFFIPKYGVSFRVNT